jgi:hypothetical protein
MSEPINELETQRSKGGRPRRVALNDDAGLLDSMLRIQIKIAEDAKANSATRQRAADSVAELIHTRAQQRDDQSKATLTAEVSRLQGEVESLNTQINQLRASAAGKVDASEVTTLRSELTRLRTDAQTFASAQSTLQAERHRAMTALRYMLQSLGNDAPKIAMRLFVELGVGAKDLLPLFGVDADSWLRLSNYQAKEQMVDVFRKRTATNETDLTVYCRLRLAVQYEITDVEAEVRRLDEEAQKERRADTLRMVFEMKNGTK